MKTTTSEPSVHASELERFEILRTYKTIFLGDGSTNRSPFGGHNVVRYDTPIEGWDVPAIHEDVREAIRQNVVDLASGQPSRVVVFAGAPGMGKSHLLNYFRNPAIQDELGYVFVGNSNHWKVDEFEGCLLTWMVAALARKTKGESSLLSDKIEDIAFQALDQILDQPGKLRDYVGGRSRWGDRVARLWWRLGPDQHARFRQAVTDRDASIFRRLDFHRFAAFVCERFLHDHANPFHSFVLHVLLRYLFPEDRKMVLAWLIGQKVDQRFLDHLGKHSRSHVEEPADPSWPDAAKINAQLMASLGIADGLNCNYKLIDTIKILASLFAPDRNKSPQPSNVSTARVFFFAFDQVEGRDELFDSEDDWFKFFAKLSELYNTLPNVFVVFTMTLAKRNELYPKMERQFQQRIQRDQKFVLHEIPDHEVLALYRRHLEVWRRGNAERIEPLVANPDFIYLPLTLAQVLEKARQKTLREMLDEFDVDFRSSMLNVSSKSARQEFLVALNELKEKEKASKPFPYTERHLEVVEYLMRTAGGIVAQGFDLSLVGTQKLQTADGLAGLRIELRKSPPDERWVRFFVVRLPFVYVERVEKCLDLLYYKGTGRYFLWLVRPERINAEIEARKPGQVFARKLPLDTHSRLDALSQLLEKQDRLSEDPTLTEEDRDRFRKETNVILGEEFKQSYLGEMFQQAREALERQEKGAPNEDD